MANNRPCTRRRFLGLSLAATTGVISAACGDRQAPRSTPFATLPPTGVPEGPTLAPATAVPITSPTAPASPSLTLDELGGDVWLPKKRITGKVTGRERCREVHLQVGDRRVEPEWEGESFSVTVPLPDRETEIQLVCEDLEGEQHTSEPVTYVQRLPDIPRAVIEATLAGGRLQLSAEASTPSELNGSPIASYRWWAREGNPIQLVFDGMMESRASVELPREDGEYYLTLEVTDEAGRRNLSTTYFVVEGGEARLPDQARENAAWIEGAVIYGIISRYYGPRGLKDVTERLDYFRDLRVNALWLAPIYQMASDGFGYEVTDYFVIRPDDGGGTRLDFQELVQEAHKRGIRVLLDFVPNHTSVEHPYFLDAEQHGERSRYYDFYARDPSGNYTYYFEYDHLANHNFDNPEVRHWVMEAFSYWVREFDVDGFRVDMAWAVMERRPDFWPEWRRELHRLKPDLLLLGEASARFPVFFNRGFDAAYDWTENLGEWAWHSVFNVESLVGRRLDAELTNYGYGYSKDALIFRFLNNNDTGERFVTRYGPELTRVAAAALLTLPGLPCVYTGDEIGEEFEPYDEGCCISWRDPHKLRPHYRRLMQLRNQTPALRSRQWTPVTVDPAGSTYGYVRYTDPARDPMLVLLNFSAEAGELEVQVPRQFGPLLRAGALQDELAGERLGVRGGETLRVPMPSYSARVLTPSV